MTLYINGVIFKDLSAITIVPCTLLFKVHFINKPVMFDISAHSNKTLFSDIDIQSLSPSYIIAFLGNLI